MTDIQAKDVLKVILEIAKSIKYSNIYNERYLHHFFSHILQNKHNLLNLTEDSDLITLHPEWPVNKKKTGIQYSKGKGNIDFVVGNYNKPEIGIEFKLIDGWRHNEIVGDFIKLLDKNIPFKVSISYNLIIRKNKLVEKGLTSLVNHMNNGYKDAINKLGSKYDASRELYLIVTEIDRQNRRHWFFDKTNAKFKEGLPKIEDI